MSAGARRELLAWCNRGNPSSGYESARAARAMMKSFRDVIEKVCDLNNEFTITFTSGASEANCTIIRGVVDAYAEATGAMPHIIVSAIEHKSVLLSAESLESRGIATVTYVAPTKSGHILPADIAAAITESTCLIAVMHANNETGAINDVAEIGRIAHAAGVPFHCDTVQTFGRGPMRPRENSVDSFCVSFHKFGGPPGVGLLVARTQFLRGYGVAPLIFGTQNDGYRGGTEPLPLIGAAFCALKDCLVDRVAKNTRVAALRHRIFAGLSAAFPSYQYTNAEKIDNSGLSNHPVKLVFLSGDSQWYTAGTILVSIVKRDPPAICNVKIKEALEKRGIIVSIGSACNTASPKASHVLYAMECDPAIRAGVLRISLGDANNTADSDTFVSELTSAIRAQTRK